jgi:hypothetical protein
MEKPTTKLSPQDCVILFCVATGIHHASVGIIDHAIFGALLKMLRAGLT